MITRVFDQFKDPASLSDSFYAPTHIQFFRLPEHIMQQILILLPSGDVRNLRLSSRAWASIPLRNPFWASRFYPGHEFQHIYEARSDLTWQNWKDTFFAFKSRNRTFLIQKRKLVYDRACEVLRWLNDFDTRRCEGQLSRDDNGSQQWAGVHVHDRDLLSYGGVSFRGLSTTTEAEIPPDLAAIYVSTVSIGARGYVSGIRMQCSSGLNICLGYIGEESRLFVQDDITSCHPEKHTSLYGLHLLVNQAGIRGLAVLSCHGVPYAHIGCFQDSRNNMKQHGLLTTDMNRQMRPLRAIRCKVDVIHLSLSVKKKTC